MEKTKIEKILDEIEEKGEDVWLEEYLVESFLKARKGKRGTYDEHKFELNWEENILNLAQSIKERNYRPGASTAFVVFEPMVREIFAAPFRDRSVHHMMYDLSAEWFDTQFVETSSSCRVGKGTLWAVKRAQQHMLEAMKDGEGEAWVVKLDIKGYFMSLPRQKVLDTIKVDIRKQLEPYMERPAARKLLMLCDFVWEQIIMDDPVKKARKKGNPANWDPEVLPQRKSLYGQEPNRGIVIGNLTSQMASNIFLHQLDKYITEILGYKYYGRYVDDFYIMVPEKQKARLKKDIKKIERFLLEELGLVLHPDKRYFQNVKKGMPFLGARIYPHCLYPSDRLQKNFWRAVRKYDAGKGSIETVISYFGLMKHLNADKFIKKVFKEVGWDYESFLETKKEYRRPMEDLVREMAHK